MYVFKGEKNYNAMSFQQNAQYTVISIKVLIATVSNFAILSKLQRTDSSVGGACRKLGPRWCFHPSPS